MKGKVTGWTAALSQVVRKDSYGRPVRGPHRVGGPEGVHLELRSFLESLHSGEEGRVQG